MSDAVTVVWDDDLRSYDFGPGHPLAPIRVQLAMRLALEFGLLQPEHVSVHSPVQPATIQQILAVHTPDYIDAVVRASSDPLFNDHQRGLGTADDPVFLGMHEASATRRPCSPTTRIDAGSTTAIGSVPILAVPTG